MSDEQSALSIPPAAIERLRAARSVFALTGAGVSAESGIPTFRAPGTGLWSQYKIQDFATPDAWRRNPPLIWSWYTHRRRLARRAQPNPAHLALAEMERREPQWTLATQNVDGLHQRAGSSHLFELHGSLFRFRCAAEDTPVAWEDPDDDDPAALERLERGEVIEPPPCPRCGAALRPDVVWFEEPMPLEPWEAALLGAEDCDVCLVVGTSVQVMPAALLPYAAQRRGAYLIEINPEETEMSGEADWAARAPAGEILPAMLRATWPNAGV